MLDELGFSVGFLQLTFIILKLANQITWSWFWVGTPLWAVMALMLVAIIANRIGRNKE